MIHANLLLPLMFMSVYEHVGMKYMGLKSFVNTVSKGRPRTSERMIINTKLMAITMITACSYEVVSFCLYIISPLLLQAGVKTSV